MVEKLFGKIIDPEILKIKNFLIEVFTENLEKRC